MRSILLVGAGGHARACIDVVEQEGRFSIAGLIGTRDEVGSAILGYSVRGDDEAIASLATEFGAAIVAVGQIKSPEVRIRLFELLTTTRCELPVIVSPRAYVSRHATLGEGTIVMHGAIVNAAAKVGRNCIINSQALIEHDSIIEDHCHIATGAKINSGVRVGVATFVGSNSSVRQGLVIGEGCVIGMGQRVLTNCAAATQLPPRVTSERGIRA